jgi:hypothetical protein
MAAADYQQRLTYTKGAQPKEVPAKKRELVTLNPLLAIARLSGESTI